MFKKPSDVDVSRSSALGGKDVKKLKSRCLALLPNLNDAGFDELFPGKTVVKTKLKIGAVIYLNVDSQPMIVDPSNDHMDTAIPTIYALALLPELVPSIEVNASAVSSTMMRGSDLFLQGVNHSALVSAPPFLQASFGLSVYQGIRSHFAWERWRYQRERPRRRAGVVGG